MVLDFWHSLPCQDPMFARLAVPKKSPLPVYPSRGSVPGSTLNFQMRFLHPAPLVGTFQRAAFKCGVGIPYTSSGRTSPPLSPLCFQSPINACEPFATVDSKRLTIELSPLESSLTGHPQLIENTATLSPLEATLTRFFAVTPLDATLTRNWGEGRSLPLRELNVAPGFPPVCGGPDDLRREARHLLFCRALTGGYLESARAR